MIISASRRTDIPAFYADWLIGRVRDGYCSVRNDRTGASKYVSLKPEDVDVIVFWTRNAKPLLPYFEELDQRGLRYYFLYTITGYPRSLETSTPPVEQAVATLSEVSDKIGPDRVVWRYDPILCSEVTPPEYHVTNFSELARRLSGITKRVVVSLYIPYGMAEARLAASGLKHDVFGPLSPGFGPLMRFLGDTAASCNMKISSCADEVGLNAYGIQPGKCIDAAYIQEVFGSAVGGGKDHSQRKACGCVKSVDIGSYDHCAHGCVYCYATTDPKKAKTCVLRHNAGETTL